MFPSLSKLRWIALGFAVASAPAIAQLAPLSGPVQVNGAARGAHQGAMAINAAGVSMAVWESTVRGDEEFQFPREIRARSYGAGGAASSIEFIVGSGGGRVFQPAIAAGSNGEFLVAWLDYDEHVIRARRLGSAGQLLGEEFTVPGVNVDVFGNSLNASAIAVAGSAAGRYVIAYTTYDQDTGLQGIHALRYASDGSALDSSEIEIVLQPPVGFPSRAGRYGAPALAMDAAGGFIAVWEQVDSPGLRVLSRRFDNAGLPLQAAQFTNTASIDSFYFLSFNERPVVSMNARGDAVVAWAVHNRARRFPAGGGALALPGIDLYSDQIQFRRYDSLGNALGDEQTAAGSQLFSGIAIQPDVAMASDGRFRLSWATHYSASDSESALAALPGFSPKPAIFLRTYLASGQSFAVTRAVSTGAAGGPHPRGARLAINAAGDCMIGWTTHEPGLLTLQDQYAGDLFQRRFNGC